MPKQQGQGNYPSRLPVKHHSDADTSYEKGSSRGCARTTPMGLPQYTYEPGEQGAYDVQANSAGISNG